MNIYLMKLNTCVQQWCKVYLYLLLACILDKCLKNQAVRLYCQAQVQIQSSKLKSSFEA